MCTDTVLEFLSFIGLMALMMIFAVFVFWVTSCIIDHYAMKEYITCLHHNILYKSSEYTCDLHLWR